MPEQHPYLLYFETNTNELVQNREEMDAVPALWKSIIRIQAFVDAVKHQLFHGITADIYRLLDEFMMAHGLGAGFEKKINPYLKEIQSLHLAWCKVKPVPKASWLTDDLLGFARLLPFIYGVLFLDLDTRDTTNTSDATIS